MAGLPASQASLTVPSVSKLTQPRSILIVCDKPLGVGLARSLVALKHPARVAGSLNAAFTILRSSPPDVVVISSGIAGGTGCWLVGQIREMLPAIRVILWSAGPESRSLPGVPIVRKDYDLTTILSAVNDAIAAGPATQGARSALARSTQTMSPSPAGSTRAEFKEHMDVGRALNCPVKSSCPTCHGSVVRASFNSGRWRASYRCGCRVTIPAGGQPTWESRREKSRAGSSR